MNQFYLFIILSGILSSQQTIAELPFVIIIPSYCNINYYQQNLDSVIYQDYDNYRIIYIDDCSPDNTGLAVEKYFIEQKIDSSKFILVKNKNRNGALANIYNNIHERCKDHEIVLIVDGDDRLYNSSVLKRLNQVYTNPKQETWLTFGQYIAYPTNQIGPLVPVPVELINNNSFRSWDILPTHLRTFYAWLFKKIKKEDLLFQGKFLPMAYDVAIMFPMIEMCAERHSFISDILYIYNIDNPISDNKVNVDLQLTLDKYIRNLPAYRRLDTSPLQKEPL